MIKARPRVHIHSPVEAAIDNGKSTEPQRVTLNVRGEPLTRALRPSVKAEERDMAERLLRAGNLEAVTIDKMRSLNI